MTSPPPYVPRSHRAQQARHAGITRIVQTDDLPAGVDALASADGKTVIVRASLDQVSRRRAMREVMASIRRFPRLALYPALSLEAIRQLMKRIAGAVTSASQTLQQLMASLTEHGTGIAVAVTAAVGTVAVATVVAFTAAPNAGTGAAGGQGTGSPTSGPHTVVHATLPATKLSYLGVYEPGVPQSLAGVNQFVNQVSPVNIALYYSSWYEQFKIGFAEQAWDEGITPAVQIEPWNVSLAAIAAGKYDTYLTEYANQVKSFGQAVIIGFGHEPNGGWYPWGASSVSPEVWIAAWRHIVTLFDDVGAENVIWLWTVDSQGPDAGMAAAWWPGASYVDWIGIDGYYQNPSDTFNSVFGTVLSVVQGYSKPILISETAVGPDTENQPAGITNLLNGVRANGLLGLIWFDTAQNSGEFHQDWRLEGNQSAVAAFKNADYISS
jgi:mannan endo-1,4-beta-mannosidase